LLSLVILLTGFSKKATAQYYFYNDKYYDKAVLFEIGGSIGLMNCLTDLGGKKGIGKKFFKDLNFGYSQMAFGVYLSAMHMDKVGIRLEGTFGKIAANDNVLAGIKDIAAMRFNRNLSFRSNITEFAALLEVHPLHLLINWEARDEDPPRYSPYLLGGFGYFSFNPQTQLDGVWIDLQPLSTEGQGFEEYPDKKVYKLQQTNIPFGGGIRYDLSELLSIRAEVIYRKLNTDYLDDVSTTYIDPTVYYNHFTGSKLDHALQLNDRQIDKIASEGGKRGSPKEKDAYFTINLKVGLILGRPRIK
jgi:hypothetical protein